jgi:hypothetical protein
VERKQGLTAVKQNGGGGSTPPPCTGGDSNGGRELPEHGGSSLQQSDDSEGERKREGLGSGVAVVWCSEASRGPFYRVERGRELGFPEVAVAGKSSGRGGSGGDVGHMGRSGGVLRLLRTRYGRLVTSATVGSRALWSVDWEEKERETSPFTGRGPVWSNGKSTAGREGVSSGMARSARSYGNGVGYSGRDFLNLCSQGVRSNARMNSNFEFLKSFTLGCQHIKQGFQRYFF